MRRRLRSRSASQFNRDALAERLFLRLCESFRDFVPTDDIPPRVHVVGSFVLILQVVRVFPNINTHERRVAVHDGRVLIGRTDNGQFAIGTHRQP